MASDFASSVKKFFRYVLVVVLILFFFALNPFINIEAGERGVLFDKLRGGIQEEALDEGLHFIIPFFQKVVSIPVRTQRVIFSSSDYSKEGVVLHDKSDDKRYARLSAASSDLQDVYVDAVLTYHLDPTKVARIYQDFGVDFASKKVVPKTIDAVKTYTAKYKVADILTKREEIKKNVLDSLQVTLASDDIILEDISLTNFDFNAQFKDSIEQKQIEEQKAQKEEYLLKQKEIQVQQRIKEAEANKQSKILEGEGIAEYNKLIQLEITEDVLEYKRLENIKQAIEAWNGTYPATYFGGGAEQNPIPLIQLQ